jgi:membrane protease YdiL (CAAX protease family)
MKKYNQLIIISVIFLSYCAFMLLSNIFMSIAESREIESFQMVSGILFGFIGIPVFSIILPIYFANKWELNYSLWPKSKRSLPVIGFILMYIALTNYSSLQIIFATPYKVVDLIVHYTSTLLFHITYYPLLVILIFPVIRKKYGIWIGIAATSILFALYHLTQYHFFPAGTTPFMQVLLAISFAFSILIYLWSQSIILVSLLHSTNGAIGLLSNGKIFNEVDFLFYLTIIIVVSLLAYYIYRERYQIRKGQFDSKWWLRIRKLK